MHITLFFKRLIVPSIVFLSIMLLLNNCEKETKEKKDMFTSPKMPVTIDVGDLLDKKSNILNIKELIDTIELVPLETNDYCLLKYIRSIVFNENYIYIGQVDGLYQFNRYGEFIQQIGVRGKGPHEYTQMRGFVVIKDTIFINSAHKLMLFDENGFFLNAMPFQDILYFEKFHDYYISYDTERGKIFFLKKGKLLSSFICDYDTGFNTKPVMIIYPNTTIFIRNVNGLMLTNDYNDTIWQLKSPDEIVVRYIVDMGKYRLPSKYRVEHVGKNFQRLSSPYLRKCVYSTNKYLFIVLSTWFPYDGKEHDEYLFVYDKRKNKTFLISEEDGRVNRPVLVPFSSNGNGCLITYKNAYEIADYVKLLEENQLPVVSAEPFLGNIKDGDNPVIIKAKLK